MRTRTAALCIAVALLTADASQTLALAQAYSVVNLGTLGGSRTVN